MKPITVHVMKSNRFIGIDHDNDDQIIQGIIDDTINDVIEYLDSLDYTDLDSLPDVLYSSICEQINYIYRRREDPGLSSITYVDGSIHKYQDGQWLKSVREKLDRFRYITI